MAAKKTQEEKLNVFFDKVITDIINNGGRTVKVKTLVNHFGYAKRSPQNVEKIKNEITERGLFTQPEYSLDLKFESNIRISAFRFRQLGDLFKSEVEFEKYVEKKKLYTELGLTSVKRQYSPTGTRDRLDFLGETADGQLVVLELKNAGGGKTAVEQVLRYNGLIKLEFPKAKIRTILVTGVQNYETALAIKGMSKGQRKSFEWYLYKYHKSSDVFSFEKIENLDI